MVKMIKVLRIPFNGKPETIQIEKNLESYQGLVGGMIELVYLNSNEDPESIMVVNEEGLIHNLLFNPIASEIVGRRIVGNAFIINQNDLD